MSDINEKERGNSTLIGVVVVAVVIIAALLVMNNNANSKAAKADDSAKAQAQTEADNIKMVQTYEDLAFNTKDVNAAAAYLSADFKQHNPTIPDGKEGFLQGVGGYLVKTYPHLKVVTKQAIAKGDRVVFQKFGKYDDTNAADPGLAIVDIYRIAGGKIAEHWDVIEAVPATSANTNTMF